MRPKPARCGSRRRAARPARRAARGRRRTLRIEFELYPRRRTDRPSLGTMVDVEGGPGYSTTDSRDSYLELHDRLMDRRDLLLVDQRGTGLSGRSTAPRFAGPSRTTSAGPGACARQLGSRVDFYGTHAAVDDLADVLDALGIEQIDLYGDSYGSYFAQAFAVRRGDAAALARARRDLPAAGHRPGVRRPGRGDLARAALVCARRPSCAARGEDPLAVLQRLVERVRASPLSGIGINVDGERIRVRVDEDSLVTLVQSGYGNMPMYRDLLAAIRAFEAGDRAPLLRLLAENTFEPVALPLRGSSEAQYLAVICHDYPQMWDPAASLADCARRSSLSRGRAAGRALRAVLAGSLDVGASTRAPNRACAGPARAARSAGAARCALSATCPRWSSTATLTTSPQRRARRSSPRASPARRSSSCSNSIHVTALGDRDDCAPDRAPLHRGRSTPATRAARTGSRRSAPSTTFPRTAADAEPADRAPATRAGRGRGARRRSPPRRLPMRSSAGRSTSAARAGGYAADAGATRGANRRGSRSTARASLATSR